LEARKLTIDADTSKAVETLDAEIYNLDNDGKLNEELTTKMRDRRDTLQDKAATDKEAIDKEILALMREASNGKAEAVQANANVKPWAPLFVGIAQLVTWTKEPTDWAIYLCAIGFVIFWVLLGESLVIFLPERIYTMHLHDAENRHEAVSPDVPAGHVRVEMPEEEWAAYQKAKAVHDNIQTGAKKGARTRRQGNKIEQSKQYAEERISEFMVLKNQGMSTAQIAAKFGLTPATIELQYGAYMTAEEHAALFGQGYQPEPEPEPPVAVSDSPQDSADGADDTPPDEPEAETEIAEPEVDDTELDIPPEPREYGIDVWKPQQDDEEEKRDELV
jgi:hypothetical protein